MTMLLSPSGRRWRGLALAAVGFAGLSGCTFNLVKIDVQMPGAARPAATTQPAGLTEQQAADLDRLWSASHE